MINGLVTGKLVRSEVMRGEQRLTKRRQYALVYRDGRSPGWDIVFIARPVAATADYASLKESVRGLLSRAGLLKTAENSFRRV